MLASTFMDMVLGVDIHFEMVPMPAPVPTPLPNPFVGMVFDPGGLLTGQAMSLAMALVTGTPPKGPVLINFMPATVCGTNAKNSLGVPHILMPPGTAWAPMPKLPKPAIKGPPPPPGPPVAPEGDAISVFGSQTVEFMGASAVRMGDQSMSCGEPVRLPSSTVLAIPKGAPVLVGGPPALSISDALGALLKSKWVAGYLHDLLSRMAPGRLRNLLSKAVCFLTGHPVDVATGRVLTDHVDFELPGPLPLKFERNYASSWANRAGPLGHGWSHSLDQAVWAERGKLVYLDGEGRELEFDTFDFPDHVLPAGQSVFEPISALTLKSLGHRRFEITNREGLTSTFEPVPGATGVRQWWSRLTRQTARTGGTIELEYDRAANLAWVKDSAGRQIAFDHDRAGRLIAVKLPHPAQHGWEVHTRYAYDDGGDLTRATDPLGNSWTFAYKQHLLVRETNRNGLSFYFAYDGHGEDAYCIRTWGDGGIYDHVLDYDKAGKVTCVTNSLGHTTTYKMNVVGCVTEVMDPLGGATKYEYDERTLRKIKETNPVGGETSWTYDARGNCTKVVGPDKAQVRVEFNDRDQPVLARDPLGGEWQWGYDEQGRLVGRVDPLARRVQFHWRSGGDSGLSSDARSAKSRDPRWGVKRMVGMTDPAGQQTLLDYDAAGNISSLRTPDGAISRWQYDNLGRCTAAIDAKGSVQSREYDALGRVVRVREADGNLRELTFDAEGELVEFRDRQHHVRMTYQGSGRLASRSEAGTIVRFVYDTEERLLTITNESGETYRLERDAAGRVEVEEGFERVKRRYLRDKAGQVVKVFRPDDRTTEVAYDEAGRLAAVAYDTGESEAYAYRLDGELIEARNDTSVVKLERDALGRIVREVAGDDWVASSYDALGARTRIHSSRGLDERIRRDALGRAIGMRASTAGEVSDGKQGWEARITRDVMGLEIERAFTGGLTTRWERDAVGRPVKQEVWSAGEFRRAVQYSWDANDRLKSVVDALRGPTRYEHDALGRLSASIGQDGRVDLRMPDAVGNLFRARDRTDRRYGPGGRLLQARRDDGGLTTYEYDAEGNLVVKTELLVQAGAKPRVWRFRWNGAGKLAAVIRPDGEQVSFTYDALARRLSKTFRGLTTRWIWAGHAPLHEWVERESSAAPAPPAGPRAADAAEIAGRARAAALNELAPQGPPDLPAHPGAADSPITWLFDPETLSPVAKLAGGACYSIVSDHLGTPIAMYDQSGDEVWAARADSYGKLVDVRGAAPDCPFRWPGQYEDQETGLYYNRHRYYDPDSGEYTSPDPVGIAGGPRPYGYVADPLVLSDPFGLKCTPDPTPHVFWSGGDPAMNAAAAWAEAHGATTLEMTARGARAVRYAENLAWEEAKPIWAKQSKMFAKEAAGEVHIFVTPAAMTNPSSVLNSVELPALKNNPNVTNIIFHPV
ncbi:MAG TPA: DUF6531 domain-containing protein [Polyangia bacterium]|nr:DUF6531 domain-containing protein [Polyangia bacterium]